MIPTIEQIVHDLLAGKVSQELAIEWLNQHADSDGLREQFAMVALQGELASQDARADGKGTGVVTIDSLDGFASRVWKIADAMMRSR